MGNLSWYFMGLAIGIVIGMPAGSEIVTRMDRDHRDAAAAGNVSPAQHCRALLSLNGDLNEQYKKRAGRDVAPSRFEMTQDQCVKMLTPAP